jgi:hypothetical protein
MTTIETLYDLLESRPWGHPIYQHHVTVTICIFHPYNTCDAQHAVMVAIVSWCGFSYAGIPYRTTDWKPPCDCPDYPVEILCTLHILPVYDMRCHDKNNTTQWLVVCGNCSETSQFAVPLPNVQAKGTVTVTCDVSVTVRLWWMWKSMCSLFQHYTVRYGIFQCRIHMSCLGFKKIYSSIPDQWPKSYAHAWLCTTYTHYMVHFIWYLVSVVPYIGLKIYMLVFVKLLRQPVQLKPFFTHFPIVKNPLFNAFKFLCTLRVWCMELLVYDT